MWWSLGGRLAILLDFVFQLEVGQALVVEHFADLAAVELEVRVHEVAETDQTHEDEQVRVVALALGLERIVRNLVTIRQIMDVVLLVPLVAVRVTGEDLVMAINNNEIRPNVGRQSRLTCAVASRCGVCTSCPARRSCWPWA